MQVITAVDPESGALMARNPFHPDYPSTRIAFVDAGPGPRTVTADRAEFLGRNGSIASPAAMARTVGLAAPVGAALDPAPRSRSSSTSRPASRPEVTFVLGQAESIEEARRLLARSTATRPVRARPSPRSWSGGTRSSARSRSEDARPGDGPRPQPMAALSGPELPVLGPVGDLPVGRAPTASATSCRTRWRWSTASRAEARAQLLRAASRQFVEGDVQHWWHPPAGKGIRTRITDDLIFLPYVAAHYVATTGDLGVLDEVVPFLDRAPCSSPGRRTITACPAISTNSGTLYDHCCPGPRPGPTDLGPTA